MGGFDGDNITTGNGNDIINAGPGIDSVFTGSGDDAVYVYDECELEYGETMIGGPGYDILYLPFGMNESDLVILGTEYSGFEEIIQLDPSQAVFSDCF